MELTAAQRSVVDHRDGRLRVTGAAATGKTTALRARYLALARDVPASRVLVVCRDRAASMAFRDEILTDLRGGFDSLPITTVFGVAHDLASRSGNERRLLGQREQWAMVEAMLADDERGAESLWPTLHRYVGRRAFADEVARAVTTLREADPGPGWAPPDDRWAELAAFAVRYQAHLDELDATDGAGLLTGAAQIAAGGGFDRFDHVIVDDGHDLSAPAARLVATLGAPASTLAVAGDPEVATRPDAEPVACLAAAAPDPVIEIVLDQRFSPAPVEEAMVSGHPSMEGEAIAAVLLEAAAGGVAWEDMAVLVRHRSHRATALTRALARHRIPLAGAGPRPGDEPLVRGVVDLLRWAGGDVEALPRLLGSPLADIDPLVLRAVERQARDAGLALADDPAVAPLRTVRDELAERAARSTPAQLAHHVYRRLIAPTVPDPSDAAALDDAAASGLDAVVALVDGLSRWCERNPEARLDDYLSALDAPDAEPDPWRTGHRRGPGVTITSIAAATGRRWHTVVVAGCLEGELPRVSGFIPFFDPDRLNGEARPVAVRRQASLAVEQRRFHLARTRATHQLVASAGPEAKDLVSRFIIDWPRRPVALPARVHHASPALRPTEGLAPVFPSGALVLSASQLATFADCPLKYAFAYGLRVRDAGNVWASLGSLAHDILDRFLSQGDPALHTWERLLELVDECWTDDVAPYRPQRERIRRDLLDMLEGWWNEEGNDLDPASVLSTELDFDIAVGPHRVVGKIDRVDLRPDGTLEIIDYKTSQTPITQEAAADDLQLATYHLAASLTPDLMAAGAPGRLRLLFLRKMVDREQPITPDHAAVTTAKIIEAAEAILAEGYQPSVTADCDHCPFHRLCPLQAEGREVGAP